MGVQLLDKTRKINKLLHNNSSSKVVFNDICEVLTEILDSNVLVISKKGKVLGGSKCEGVPYITELIEREIGKHVDDMLNERLLSILSTKENVNLQTLGFSEDTVKDITQILFKNQQQIQYALPVDISLDETTAVDGITIPFHDGAAAYYKQHGITVNTEKGSN